MSVELPGYITKLSLSWMKIDKEENEHLVYLYSEEDKRITADSSSQQAGKFTRVEDTAQHLQQLILHRASHNDEGIYYVKAAVDSAAYHYRTNQLALQVTGRYSTSLTSQWGVIN